jgi:hypothetical protein
VGKINILLVIMFICTGNILMSVETGKTSKLSL